MYMQQHITIDGTQYGFQSGETILQVAVRNGIKISILCYLKGTTPTGAFRMCLAEAEGARSHVASCATPAAPGMVVKSVSGRVLKFCWRDLQLLLSPGHQYCVTCEADGGSRLQSRSYEYKIDTIDFREAAANVLTSRALDPVAHIPQVMVCAVRLEKVECRISH